MKNLPRNFCFLDLETTGFDPEKDSIIEVSFIIYNPEGKEIDRLDEVVFPDKSELSPFVSNLTGISQEELNQSGKKFSDLVEKIRGKIDDSVIVGHNIDFDINFLIANGLENLAKNPRIDTHELARILLPGEESYALEVLCTKYGMSHENAHRAMSDVEANVPFFYFLVEKINKLPAKFLNNIRPVLENKTDWYARTLFLESTGSSSEFVEKFAEEKPLSQKDFVEDVEKLPEFREILQEKIKEVSPENSLFIRQTDNLKSAKLAKKIAETQSKALIVTPKLNYFPEIKQFPSPQVILDPEKLEKFAKSREKMSDAETTFWVQAKFREFLGRRGKRFFDLFFQQRDFWETVCLNDKNHPLFQKIVTEKNQIKVLAIDPYTFLELIDLEIFRTRTLVIDEAENFAKTLLFSASQNWSFLSALNTEDEKKSTAAQFWVTNFCREIIEEKLQHTISPFPERILLDKTEKFPVFANGLDNLAGLKKKNDLYEVLINSREKTVRWATYSPQNGNLVIGAWHPDDWRDLKNKLAKFSKIFFHRHKIDDSFSFFRIFIGVAKGNILSPAFLKKEIKLTIPNNLISVKSPDFNAYTQTKIEENFAETLPGEVLAVSFSSLETLKKIFYELTEKIAENEKIYGENVSGGTPKILNLMQQNSAKKQLLLLKSISTPALNDFRVKKMIIQKFIFDPPHPLLEEIENVMKISGLSFWEVWVMPQITANFSRIIGSFSELEEVVFLDARENSRWGKEILKTVFE